MASVYSKRNLVRARHYVKTVWTKITTSEQRYSLVLTIQNLDDRLSRPNKPYPKTKSKNRIFKATPVLLSTKDMENSSKLYLLEQHHVRILRTFWDNYNILFKETFPNFLIGKRFESSCNLFVFKFQCHPLSREISWQNRKSRTDANAFSKMVSSSRTVSFRYSGKQSSRVDGVFSQCTDLSKTLQI